MTPLISSLNTNYLSGEISVAGDKSISHRALIFSALANGISNISGLLEGEDVLRTATALRKIGAKIIRQDDKNWQVNGVGYCGLQQPDDVLDMGNSGTSTRLLMGLVAPLNFTTFFTGDSSLRKRPMQRVFEPLKDIGAQIISRNDNVLPAAIIGAEAPLPINYKMKVASAQVKSAIMLAALNINGTTTIIEPEQCRDHTEIMMQYLGLDIKVEKIRDGKVEVFSSLSNEEEGFASDIENRAKVVNKIIINGCNDFAAKDFVVPGDISSAAFIIVAALITPNSKIKINNVSKNSRTKKRIFRKTS